MRILSTLALAVALLCVAVPGADAGAHAGEQPRGEWPLRPRPEVVGRFDPPDSPYGAGHRGVDLRGRPGQQVRAAVGGVVTFAGLLAGRGVVVVDHGATRTTYEPVAAGVRVGQSVTAGSPIGTLQRFGSHCWPQVCLHWGLIEGERYLDPLSLVGPAPVRLLPLAGSLPWRPPALGPPVRHVGVPAGRPGAADLW